MNNKKVLRIFSEKCGGCNVQHGGCPCNTCFHAIEGVDFQHICWLLLLGIRGDYPEADILKELKKALRGA